MGGIDPLGVQGGTLSRESLVRPATLLRRVAQAIFPQVERRWAAESVWSFEHKCGSALAAT